MDTKRLERVEDKLDKVVDSISNINVTLAKQSVILEEHVKRSTMLEDQMKPIKKHVDLVNAAFKLLGLLISVGGIHGLMKLFKVY